MNLSKKMIYFIDKTHNIQILSTTPYKQINPTMETICIDFGNTLQKHAANYGVYELTKFMRDKYLGFVKTICQNGGSVVPTDVVKRLCQLIRDNEKNGAIIGELDYCSNAYIELLEDDSDYEFDENADFDYDSHDSMDSDGEPY